MSSLQVALVVASHRPGSQSRRIADHLNREYFAGQGQLIDLHEQVLPQWDGSPGTVAVQQVQQQAAAADAFVFVVPEWHGMVPAALKNFLLWCGAAELAHKPVLLVGLSSGVGGAFVVAELRSSGYKNSRLLYLPEHLILRDVTHLWVGEAGRDSDRYLSSRAAYATDLLKTYAATLRPVRAQLCAGLAEFANGMS